MGKQETGFKSLGGKFTHIYGEIVLFPPTFKMDPIKADPIQFEAYSERFM